MRYFDASALVKRYVQEDGAALVRRLLRAGAVATSRLSEVEIASALARRAREGTLPAAAHQRAVAALAHDIDAWAIVEVTPRITRDALELLRAHDLRTGDAIQLASCIYLQRGLSRRVEFIAFDEGLTHAARAEGIAVREGL